MVCGVDGVNEDLGSEQVNLAWPQKAKQLLEKASTRATKSGVFGPGGHPWTSEIRDALLAYHRIHDSGGDLTDWLEDFKLRTVYWCAQILNGLAPFPPKPKPRTEDATALIERLNECLARRP